uniref:EGF-like domain-containing protein n=1 Tax=Scophthalmus maximus TaxID=52904 RepID=A0A8D3BWQ1_SCOMX
MKCLPAETAVVFILDSVCLHTFTRPLSGSDAFDPPAPLPSPSHSLQTFLFNSSLTKQSSRAGGLTRVPGKDLERLSAAHMAAVTATVYAVAYRQVSRVTPPSHSYPECCPGWRRFHSHNCNRGNLGQGVNLTLCGDACVNGGTCLRPDQCACPPGWTGRRCQSDVDECSEQRPCAQGCVNTAGSYPSINPVCWGSSPLHPSFFSPPPPPPPPPPHPVSQLLLVSLMDHIWERLSCTRGGFSLAENVTEEVQSLRDRVELLEKKLQLVLAPFSSVYPLSLDEGVSEKTTLLSHSFQQLDRIDSLSEQIGFLEERLGTCE